LEHRSRFDADAASAATLGISDQVIRGSARAQGDRYG
jgi:hypothetical protein